MSAPTKLDPQPVCASHEPEPFPLDAVPDSIRCAIEEAQSCVMAPMTMIWLSCLGSISLACQGLFDVRRSEQLTGPIGVFSLTVAESGERKSTCDTVFIKPILDYQISQAERFKPIIKKYEADMDAWGNKKKGINSAILQKTTKGQDTKELEAELLKLNNEMPELEKIPRLVYTDVTPEALAFLLSKGWESAGIISAEAGSVLGSHGMGKDSVMRNMGMLNTLWDGKELAIDRRTSECFVVRDARLTMALQVQDAVLREFSEKNGALARGSGFFARFLIAAPESTQGTRFFKDPPKVLLGLSKFQWRIGEILNMGLPRNGRGKLEPTTLVLSREAKQVWVTFYNQIEQQLGASGELHDVRDVASKITDNAARIAALFHAFEGCPGLAISEDHMARACKLAMWHLSESRRFFVEIALPREQSDVVRLDAWLIKYCKREKTHIVGKSTAMQYSPIRDKKRLDPAIKELCALDRLRVQRNGKKINLIVTPELLE